MGEIETSPEGVYGNAVDLDQVQVGIAAAQEQAGHASRGAGLIERHAGNVAQQVHRKGFIARPHTAARNYIHTGRLQGGGDFDGGTHHLHRIDARGDFQLHVGRLIGRQGSGEEAGRADDKPRVRGFGRVQLKAAVGGGGGLRNHADAVDGRDLRAGNRASGWVDNLASNLRGRDRGGKNQKAGHQAWSVA